MVTIVSVDYGFCTRTADNFRGRKVLLVGQMEIRHTSYFLGVIMFKNRLNLALYLCYWSESRGMIFLECVNPSVPCIRKPGRVAVPTMQTAKIFKI